ncbi:MAG: hypothetical protein Kow00128_22520 [Deltaproteobacteria bacterium]
MKMTRWLVLVAGWWMAAGFGFPAPAHSEMIRKPQGTIVPPKVVQQTARVPGMLSIRSLRGPELARHLNREVLSEGFYYDGSIPMVIDDFKRVLVDTPIPPDSYIPIAGPKPRGLKNGDRVKIRGMLTRPTKQERMFHRESSLIRVARPDAISVVRRSVAPYRIAVSRYSLAAAIRPIPRRYAVLIAGGISSANNHIRYWNDLKTMYAILRNAGYPAGNIHVLYADGTARDNSMPVHYSATSSNLSAVFNLLAQKMTSSDTLYIMLNDHGGGYLSQAISGYGVGNYGGFADSNGDEGNETPKIDETLGFWHQSISDDQFAAELNKITRYEKIIIQMKQCFSGGFLKELTGPRRTVMSSASENQFSWSHSSGQFGEFTFWYFAALTGSKPDGSGAVNADANGDGKVSILEAYNFARSHDTRPEIPFFEDDGVVPAHSGAMPAGGDGTRSASIFLR